MRRWVLLLVALALAAGPVAFAPFAAAADVCAGGSGPCIEVTVIDGVGGGSTQYFEWADVRTDFAEGCAVRNKPGDPATNNCFPPEDGLTIQGLLTDAGFTAQTIQTIQLVRVNGSVNNPSTLTADELATNPSPFADGLVPAFGELDGTASLFYNRPLLNDTDTNVSDAQSTDDHGEMDVSVYVTGQVLHPMVTVKNTTVQAGTSFTATATLPPTETEPAAGSTTYNWNFYAGPVAPPYTSTTTHTYAAASEGTAYISVTVERGFGTPYPAFGTSPPLLVTVTAEAPPPHKKHHDPGTGTGKKTHPKVGPNKGKGKQSGGAPGHSSGASSTKHKATSTPSPTSTPTNVPTVPVPTLVSGATSAPAGSTATAASAPAGGTSRPRNASTKPAKVADLGAFVHGTVIDGVARPLAVAPLSSATQATAPSARQRSAQPFDARLLWWLLLPVLLGLGAVSEMKRPRSRRRRSA